LAKVKGIIQKSLQGSSDPSQKLRPFVLIKLFFCRTKSFSKTLHMLRQIKRRCQLARMV